MWRKFCGWLLRAMGWTIDSDAAPVDKCVILGVPHTSIADFIVAYLYYTSIGHVAHIMIKKEFFRGPAGWLLPKLGCIPVDRSDGATVVRSVITAVEKAEGEFHLCMAPEGTRKKVRRWKAGYHHIASAIGCPVYTGYFDWGTKHIGVGEEFPLTSDAKADTGRLQQYYHDKGYKARHPENYFTV